MESIINLLEKLVFTFTAGLGRLYKDFDHRCSFLLKMPTSAIRVSNAGVIIAYISSRRCSAQLVICRALVDPQNKDIDPDPDPNL